MRCQHSARDNAAIGARRRRRLDLRPRLTRRPAKASASASRDRDQAYAAVAETCFDVSCSTAAFATAPRYTSSGDCAPHPAAIGFSSAHDVRDHTPRWRREAFLQNGIALNASPSASRHRAARDSSRTLSGTTSCCRRSGVSQGLTSPRHRATLRAQGPERSWGCRLLRFCGGAVAGARRRLAANGGSRWGGLERHDPAARRAFQTAVSSPPAVCTAWLMACTRLPSRTRSCSVRCGPRCEDRADEVFERVRNHALTGVRRPPVDRRDLFGDRS